VTNGATKPVLFRGVSALTGYAAQAGFNQSLIYYFQAYFKGTYVDRFGVPVPAPNSLQTISDGEIQGTVQVFLEALMDYYIQTPIWYLGDSGKRSYYPGSGSDTGKTPTVVSANKNGVMPLKLIQLVTKPPNGPIPACGITKIKAEAIQHIAQDAGNRAGQLGGQIGGGFGGINVGLGVLGKISIGDNKTIHGVITTALQKTFMRAGEESAIRVLNLVPNDKYTTLADLISAFLNAQLNPPQKS
jgi:hypothetical protein